MTDRWLDAWALGSVSFGGASLLVPLYVVQLGGTAVDLGLLAATAALIGAPGAVVFGRLANRVGHRRRLVLATLATVVLTLGALPLLGDVTAVVVVNGALWLAVGSVAPVLTMLVAADASEAELSGRIARLNTYQGYGWAGGLVLGTVWPLVGSRFVDPTTLTRLLFWLLAACAATSALLVARSLPRVADAEATTGGRRARRIGRLLATGRRGVRGATFVFSPNRLYWTTAEVHPRRLLDRLTPALAGYLFAAFLFFTGFAAFWAPLPLFLTDSGFGAGEVFGLYLVSSLASAALYGRAGAVAARYDLRLLQSGTVAARGLLFVGVGLVAGTASVGLGATGVVLAAIGLTWAVIAVVGTVIVTRLAPPAVRGDVVGVYTALGAVAGGVGGVLGGWTATMGYGIAFATAGGLVLAGAAVIVPMRGLSGGTDDAPERGRGEPSEEVSAPGAAPDGSSSGTTPDAPGSGTDEGR